MTRKQATGKDSVRLVVNGLAYSGWESVRITRSLETLAGSFEIQISDRWGALRKPWPIVEGSLCQVKVGGATAIDGFVDRRSLAISASARELSVSGRDRAGVLVDSSAPLGSFRSTSLLALAQRLAEPFGVRVSLQEGLSLPGSPPRKVAVQPGETVFAVLERLARAAEVLLVSDGAGGIMLSRAGNGRVSTELAEGQNILAASLERDASQRFARYVCVSQVAGTDHAHGDATRTAGVATDEAVGWTQRVKLILPAHGLTASEAQRRADWEARIRAARAERVTVTVVGWLQPNGEPWPLNAVVAVAAPSIGVNQDLLISQLDHLVDGQSGRITTLSLVRTDAFTPEPKAVVRKRHGVTKSSLWPDLEELGKEVELAKKFNPFG